VPEPDAEAEPTPDPQGQALQPPPEPIAPELPLESRGGTARQFPPGDPAWKDRFLELLAEGFSVQGAAQVVGRSSRWCYQAKERDPEFSIEWDKAKTRRVDTLSESAWRRAIHGWDEPVFYRGVKCGTRRVYSTALTLTFLRAHIPDPYRKADMFAPGTASVEEMATKIRNAVADIDAALGDPGTALTP